MKQQESGVGRVEPYSWELQYRGAIAKQCPFLGVAPSDCPELL